MRAVPGSRPERSSASDAAVSGTLLAFDFGARRIGVAVGETATGIANPLGAIEESANEPRFRAVARLVDEWRPAAFVVGRPRHPDGAPHPVARLAEKFARRLAAQHHRPVILVDETLTSASAASELRAQGAHGRRAADVDALAAALILQSYLDQPRAHEHLAA